MPSNSSNSLLKMLGIFFVNHKYYILGRVKKIRYLFWKCYSFIVKRDKVVMLQFYHHYSFIEEVDKAVTVEMWNSNMVKMLQFEGDLCTAMSNWLIL